MIRMLWSTGNGGDTQVRGSERQCGGNTSPQQFVSVLWEKKQKAPNPVSEGLSAEDTCLG